MRSEFYAQSGLGSSSAGSSGAVNTSDYLMDAFQDFTVPAANNSGLTDNSSTNPLGVFLGNSDALTHGSKTLFIKDFKLVVDRTKWIFGIPTYQIIWTEDYPAAVGYFFGDGVIKTGISGQRYLHLSRGGMRFGRIGLGVIGIGKNASVLFNISSPDGSVPPKVNTLVDGSVDQSSINVYDGSGDPRNDEYLVTGNQTSGYDKFLPKKLLSADSAVGLHDIRVESADATAPIDISGIVFEHADEAAAASIRPGVSYIDRTKAATVVGATFSTLSSGSSLGGRLIALKEVAGYTLTSLGVSTISTIGQGNISTTSVNVTAGTGASFLPGYGIAISGTTTYVGAILSVSTDTLTVSPTLPFGVSGTVFKLYEQGPSISISSDYQVKHKINFNDSFAQQNNRHGGFGPTLALGSTLNQFEWIYSPEKEYAVYGLNLNQVNIGVAETAVGAINPFKYYPSYDTGVPVLQFAGMSGYLQVDGNFQAAKVNLFHKFDGFTAAVFAEVNGLAGFTLFLGSTGAIVPINIMTNSQTGWNSFRLSIIGDLTDVSNFDYGIESIELFKYAAGSTGLTGTQLGELVQLPGGAPHALGTYRGMPLGVKQRLYWPDMAAYGSVSGGTMPVWAVGSFQSPPQEELPLNAGWKTTTSGQSAAIRFTYYGKDFFLGGTMGTGQSLTVALDGSNVGNDLNKYYVGATNKLHEVVVTMNSFVLATRIAYADIIAPYGEVKSLSTAEPLMKRKKKKIQVPKVTPWVPYTPNLYNDGGTLPVVAPGALNRALWRQNGEDLEIFHQLDQSGFTATPGQGTYLWDLPNNFKLRGDYINWASRGSSTAFDQSIALYRSIGDVFVHNGAYGPTNVRGIMSAYNEHSYMAYLSIGVTTGGVGGGFFGFVANSSPDQNYTFRSYGIPCEQFAGKNAYETIWVDELEDYEDKV